MKTLPFLLALLSLSYFATAQHFVRENAVWYDTYYHQTGDISTVAYKFDGDTIIDNITYKKAYYTLNRLLDDWQLLNEQFRETDNGKVYKRFSDGVEILLFDYENPEIGDTIVIVPDPVYPCTGIIVSETDTLYKLLDGTPLKSWRVEGITLNGIPYDFIDTLGGSVSAFKGAEHILCFTEGVGELLCYYDNGVQKYSISGVGGGGCWTVPTTEQQHSINLIFNNPAADVLTLQYAVPQEAHLRLYDLQGRTLLARTLSPQESVAHIDVAQLPQGMYSFTLHQGHTLLKADKLVVQR